MLLYRVAEQCGRAPVVASIPVQFGTHLTVSGVAPDRQKGGGAVLV